jgi:hypothetical protein
MLLVYRLRLCARRPNFCTHLATLGWKKQSFGKCFCRGQTDTADIPMPVPQGFSDSRFLLTVTVWLRLFMLVENLIDRHENGET